MGTMFPSAGAQIYRNEDGEVLGWDDASSYEPDYDPYDGLDDDEREPPEYETVEQCQSSNMHAQDGDGVSEDAAGNTVFKCCYCPGTYIINEDSGNVELISQT